MIQLQSPRPPYPEISYIGIAIRGDSQQRHVGVLFRENKNVEPKLLHLAFHMMLKCENSSLYADDYFWLDFPSLSDDEQLQLAVWFKRVNGANGNKIPYGIEHSSISHFSRSGRFIESDENCGMTCATFVLSLFQDFGYPIVDIESWEHRDDDHAWQESIIKAMQNHQMRNPQLYSSGHISKQICNIGVAVRFRPEEVAVSASLFEDVPVTFRKAVPFAEDLLKQMGVVISPNR